MNRRQFLNYSGLCAAVAACPALAQNAMESGRARTTATAEFTPDIELELVARPAQHQILPARPTDTWSYSGRLLKGRAGVLEPSGSYLRPDDPSAQGRQGARSFSQRTARTEYCPLARPGGAGTSRWASAIGDSTKTDLRLRIRGAEPGGTILVSPASNGPHG